MAQIPKINPPMIAKQESPTAAIEEAVPPADGAPAVVPRVAVTSKKSIAHTTSRTRDPHITV